MNLSEFASKLHSIELIYNELCSLMNVSKSDFPLQIIKIESGSLFADLLGNDAVIDFMIFTITVGTNYLHKTCTTDGKMSAIPKKVETIESLLGLSQKLSEQGIDVTNLNDHIKKSSVVLATEMNNLLSYQANVQINGETLSVGNEDLKKLIEHNAPLKLEFDEAAE